MRNLVLLGLAIATFVAAQNVGIGTATPAAKLDVFGPTGTFIRVSGNLPPGDANPGLMGYELVNTAAGDAWRMYLADPDGGFGVTPRSLEFWEYPAILGPGGCCRPRFRILSSNGLGDPGEVVIGPQGYMGIGTVTPDERLTVIGPVRIAGLQNSYRLYFSDGNTDQTKYIATENFWLTFGAHSNEGFRFKDQNGNTQAQIGLGANNTYFLNSVGIGTAAPAQRLHVAGTIRSDAISGAHPGSQTYSLLGANTFGDIQRVNPSHGYLFSYSHVCSGTVEGSVRATITNGTLTVDVYNEGGGYVTRCLTLSGIANALINLLIVNDDTGNCGGTARVSGVRSLTVTNNGGTVTVATDLGCNGSDANNMVFFIHYNPL